MSVTIEIITLAENDLSAARIDRFHLEASEATQDTADRLLRSRAFQEGSGVSFFDVTIGTAETRRAVCVHGNVSYPPRES